MMESISLKILKRPDNSKVNGVNDSWDQFESF